MDPRLREVDDGLLSLPLRPLIRFPCCWLTFQLLSTTHENSYFLQKVGSQIFYKTFGPTNLNNWQLSNGGGVPSLTLSSTNIPSDDINTGTISKMATNTITATNKITGTAKVTYLAGKSVTLTNGFKADKSTVFKATIGGCL